MPQSATAPLVFAPPVASPLAVDFRGGRLTSDGGWCWVAEADQALGLCSALAAAIPDRRRRGRHTLLDLLRQRIYQIAAGYEDQDDADTLRHDPLLKLVCGRLPERNPDLASQPTFSRFENALSARDCYRLAEALGTRLGGWGAIAIQVAGFVLIVLAMRVDWLRLLRGRMGTTSTLGQPNVDKPNDAGAPEGSDTLRAAPRIPIKDKP